MGTGRRQEISLENAKLGIGKKLNPATVKTGSSPDTDLAKHEVGKMPIQTDRMSTADLFPELGLLLSVRSGSTVARAIMVT